MELTDRLVQREKTRLTKLGVKEKVIFSQIDADVLLERFSRSFYHGFDMRKIINTFLRGIVTLQYCTVGPLLSEDDIATRLVNMGLTENLKDSKELVDEVVNMNYPTRRMLSAGRKFDTVIQKDGSVKYCLFEKVYID